MLVKEIIEATRGQLLSGNMNDNIKYFTQDSRQAKEGFMYIPLIGERHDGHKFIESAFENGASAIITQQEVSYPDKNVILVKDTHQALGDMARYVRLHSKAFVVGVTGSVGKTSTKDMIYSVVSTKYNTLKTLGNYNNDIGLPLTILRYQDEEAMIIEMGMNHLEEIDYLTRIALPDIAVITNVGTAHIGELGSRDNILKAKMEITHGLKENGILIINDDNDMLHSIKDVSSYQIKRISLEHNSDLSAENIILKEDYSTFTVKYCQKDYQVYVPVAGAHFVSNALVAIEVGLSLDISIEDCIKGIQSFELTKNRADVMTLRDSIKVIDGTYNANLDSMKASIDVLAQYQGRKIAIVGDMLELGRFEEELHRQVGQHIVKSEIDLTLAVGKASEYTVDEVKNAGLKALHFDSNDLLNEYLKTHITDNDMLLVKASNGMHLKEVINYLKENFS